jgi:hypothetical protein
MQKEAYWRNTEADILNMPPSVLYLLGFKEEDKHVIIFKIF